MISRLIYTIQNISLNDKNFNDFIFEDHLKIWISIIHNLINKFYDNNNLFYRLVIKLGFQSFFKVWFFRDVFIKRQWEG